MGDEKYRLPPVAEAPWLIATHQNCKGILEKQTFCSFASNNSNSCSVKTIVELDGMSILASSLGWLVLREREEGMMCSLYNPVTLQSLSLPMLKEAPPKERPICVVLTSAPDDDRTGSASTVILFFRELVFFCRPTGKDNCRWLKQSTEHNGKRIQITNVETVNGDVYAYAKCDLGSDGSKSRMFIRIKIINNPYSLSFDPLPLECPQDSIKFRAYNMIESYLVEIHGELHFIHMIMRHCDKMDNYDIFKAFVWRLELSEMKWIQVESLGDCAILLSDNSSTWCTTNRGDCIYLAKSGCQTMHVYQLRDDSCTFILPHRSFLGNVNGPTWFVPSNHTRIKLSPIQEKETNSAQEGKIKNAENTKQVEDTKEEADKKISSPSLSELPADILKSIANLVHLFDYMNLRATCKTICTEAPLAKWRAGSSLPLFMSLKNNKGISELWDPFELTSHTIKTPHSPSCLASIEFCKDGWLLLRNEGDSLQYFNPFTKEKGTYPSCLMTISNASYAFSTCPNSSDCVTVGILVLDAVYISCFQAATGKWEYHLSEDTEFQASYISSPKYHNGAFYFIGVKGNLGVFEMVQGAWSWKVYDGPLTEEASSSLNSCYLVELEGQLISVFFQNVGRRVQVFKFETSEKCWVKLDDLGDHMLFLSPASSISAKAKDSTMKNRIYLPRRRGNGIVYYSLDTGKYHTSGKEDPTDDFYGTSAQSFCCWI